MGTEQSVTEYNAEEMKGTMTVNIVLLEPEIPENTGNIGRTCVAANAGLHLIRPFGFILNERGLKRAGMDYWDRLSVSDYVNYDDFSLMF